LDGQIRTWRLAASPLPSSPWNDSFFAVGRPIAAGGHDVKPLDDSRGRNFPGPVPRLWGQRCREERKFNTTKDLRNRHTARSCTLWVASLSSVCVACFDQGPLWSSVGSERQEASVCFGQVRYGGIQYHHRTSPNTAVADQSISPASHCVSRWQRKRSLYCFAMQKDRLHPVVSQPALVSVDLVSIGHRWYLTTSVALSKTFAYCCCLCALALGVALLRMRN
jgi:hypothetical protein